MKNALTLSAALTLLTLSVSTQAFAQAGATENSVDSRPGTSAPDSMSNPRSKSKGSATIQNMDHDQMEMQDSGDVTHAKKTTTSKTIKHKKATPNANDSDTTKDSTTNTTTTHPHDASNE
jgi:hypothetical protein